MKVNSRQVTKVELILVITGVDIIESEFLVTPPRANTRLSFLPGWQLFLILNCLYLENQSLAFL
jgi:hypothetical protein